MCYRKRVLIDLAVERDSIDMVLAIAAVVLVVGQAIRHYRAERQYRAAVANRLGVLCRLQDA